MALGLPSGLAWESKNLIDPTSFDPDPTQSEGKILVAWYDFTDITQLYQEKNSISGTQVASDGDAIGSCVNKCMPLSGHPDPIGFFISAITDGKRPIFKTGGAGGNSYAEFTAGENMGLVGRSKGTSNNFGGVTTDILSINTKLDNSNLTIFIIGEPFDNDTDGADEIGFSYFGYNEEFDPPEDATVSFTMERQDDDDIDAVWNLGEGPVSPNTINSTNPEIHWSSGKASVITVATDKFASSSNTFTNQIEANSAQTVFNSRDDNGIPEVLHQDGIASFDHTSAGTNNSSLISSIAVGGRVLSDGTIHDSSFEGKIYEVCVFRQTLEESDRSALIAYFMGKYNLT